MAHSVVSAAETQELDLNHATERQLAAIDDMDEKLANNLVRYRIHHGHFESWDDVRQVPGIEARHVESLRRVARLGGQADSVSGQTHHSAPTRGGVP